MNIAIIGSGYVGLVAGACFAELGHDVILVDNDPAKYAALARSECPHKNPRRRKPRALWFIQSATHWAVIE